LFVTNQRAQIFSRKARKIILQLIKSDVIYVYINHRFLLPLSNEVMEVAFNFYLRLFEKY
jgi:hypothetical protein